MGGSVSLIDGHIDDVNRCVCCGEVIPEGPMVCRNCSSHDEWKSSGHKGDEAWELFDLITSVYYGKKYYFREKHGLVYSRASHEYMSYDEALSEFLDAIEVKL